MASFSDIKHILFISSWYPNRNNLTHGIFNRVFAETVALNHRVTVLHVCSDPNLNTDYEIVESEVDNVYTVIIYYKKIQNKIPFLSQYLKKDKLISLYNLGFKLIEKRNGKPKLIQLNVILPAGIGAMFLSKKYNIPLVINECWTGYMPADGNYKGFAVKYFTKKIVSQARVIMPVSNSLKQDMLKHHLRGNYQIVANVVNDELFKPNPSIQKSINKTRFIHISTFDQEQKNVIGILNAFEKAYLINNSMELTFIGSPNNSKILYELIDQKKLNQAVNIKNTMLKEDLVNEINAHDSLIMFSNYESFCLVLAETMACGLSAITSKCGGLTDIIPDFAGIKIEAKNEQQLTDAILNISKNKKEYDPEKIRQFVVTHFNQDVINKLLSSIYQSVLS